MVGHFRKLIVFCALIQTTASAQSLGYGVRGGLPLTDFLAAESKTGALTNVVRGRGDVIIGPMLELRLPMGFGIEVDALYRRWDAKGILNPGTSSTWEYPIYGKARLPGVIVRPYIGGGVNFQRLGDLSQFVTRNSYDTTRRGFLGAAGLELKVPFVRISPELRYTRWGQNGPIRSSNQVDFLIGLSF